MMRVADVGERAEPLFIRRYTSNLAVKAVARDSVEQAARRLDDGSSLDEVRAEMPDVTLVTQHPADSSAVTVQPDQGADASVDTPKGTCWCRHTPTSQPHIRPPSR